VSPHLVEVSAGAPGVVTALAVAPRERVERGQIIAVVERLWPSPDAAGRTVVVRAPVAGLVTRTWATTGDLVSASWPIVGIATCDEVLVVARFPAAASRSVRRGDPATVHVRGNAPGTRPARVVSVSPPWGVGEACMPEGRITHVVLSLPDAPTDAVWPGTPAQVEIASCA